MVAVITAFSMFGLLQICRGDQHIISGQLIGYGLASHAINNHLVNPANNLCGFFINQKMVFVLWVTPVPIGDCAAAPLAILHPGTENGSYFVAGVLCIPLIHDVQKRCEVVFRWIGTVYAVVDGDKADTFFGEHDFGVKSDFQIVTPKPGQVFDADNINLTGFYRSNHFLKARTLEVGAGVAIICKMPDILEALSLCILLQIAFLVDYGV